MFNLVHDTMHTNVTTDYTEKLDFLFREFIDLKFVLDPQHASGVITNLIYNLAAIAICKQNTYVSTIWQQTYNKEPFDIEASSGYTGRDYADQIESMIKMFADTSSVELEMIRMLICYAKCKKIDIQKYFIEMIKKFEDRI